MISAHSRRIWLTFSHDCQTRYISFLLAFVIAYGRRRGFGGTSTYHDPFYTKKRFPPEHGSLRRKSPSNETSRCV